MLMPMTAKTLAVPAVSLALQSALPSSMSLRGGGSVLDLTRVRIRLEGLHSYGVVTALLMNAALRLFSMTPKKLVPRERVKNTAKILFTVVIILSILGGAYTTVVFSLLGLYSKSALGLGQDQAFLDFFEATAFIRKQAFDTFILCLISFKTSFVLSVFLAYEDKIRWMVGCVAAVGAIYSWYHWSTIMHIAGRLLFKQ